MKTSTIYLTTTLLLASAPLVSADSAAENSTMDNLQLRYGGPAGAVKLSVLQDISASGHEHIAERTISMDLKFNTAHENVDVEISKVKGSYTAHEMTQRLPAPELTGQLLKLLSTDNGRALKQAEPDEGPVMDLGGMFRKKYSIGLALTDIMPVLPQGPVGLGSTWTTEQTTRSIEGWAWASGPISNQHTVTAIDHYNGHNIVSVSSVAKGHVGAVEGGRVYSGDGTLNRTTNWRFDATDGRLLSVSMEQETSGINTLPQGEVDIRQLTIVELTSVD